MTDSQFSACLNCGAPLEGKFCAGCGQRDIPPYPSVRELASDAVSEFSGWDGRLWATVRALVQRPGLLTREFLAGRRASYISPVRLYLSASVLYFLIAANAPNLRLESGETLGLQIKATAGDSVTTATSSRARRIGNLASGSLESGEAATPEEREAALRDIAAAPPLMRPFLRRAILDPGGFRRGLVETMPKMLFVLLPLFAGIVAIFFRGRKYPEHLYFAIHLHAFVFLALSVIALIRFTGIPLLAAAAGIIGLLWILVYATLAFHRVYGDSIGRTVLKELGIAAIYSVVAFIGFALTIYWVSIAA
jgi:hypothetical protein